MTEITVKLKEYFFWSPLIGSDAIRFSVFDGRGREYFQIRSFDGKGMTLRDLRQQVAERIYEAMENGQDPGEVM